MGAAISHQPLGRLNAKPSFLSEDKGFKHKVQVEAHREGIDQFLTCYIATTGMKIFWLPVTRKKTSPWRRFMGKGNKATWQEGCEYNEQRTLRRRE